MVVVSKLSSFNIQCNLVNACINVMWQHKHRNLFCFFENLRKNVIDVSQLQSIVIDLTSQLDTEITLDPDWGEYWDLCLQNTSAEFRVDTYDEETNNCFTFILVNQLFFLTFECFK